MKKAIAAPPRKCISQSSGCRSEVFMIARWKMSTATGAQPAVRRSFSISNREAPLPNLPWDHRRRPSDDANAAVSFHPMITENVAFRIHDYQAFVLKVGNRVLKLPADVVRL